MHKFNMHIVTKTSNLKIGIGLNIVYHNIKNRITFKNS